jgi:hypothetical protein
VKTIPALVLACAITSLVAVVSGRLQRATPVVVWDAGQYYAMARQFAVRNRPFAESPYVFRIGMPWLVAKKWPSDPQRGFFVLNLLSAVAIGVLLTIWLRAWSIGGWTPALMVALAAAEWHGPARYIFYNPGYVDPPFIALMLAGLLVIKSIADSYSVGKIVLLTLLSAAGALVRETMALVPICFLFVNGPIGALFRDGRARRSVPAWALMAPLVACLAVVAFTHVLVSVDATERSSMLQAAVQWLQKAPDAYVMGWFTAFGPVVAIVAFDWRRALRFLSDEEWLAAFLAGCVVIAFIGGSDTERFAFWSLPVVYLLLARAIRQHASTLRSLSLIVTFAIAQAVSARVFWGIPDPHSEDVVALTARAGWGEWIYGVLNRLIVIDSFHFNLWSSFGSRPFRLARLSLYLLITGGFVWALQHRAGARIGFSANNGEVSGGAFRGAGHRAEHGGVVE